MTTYKRQSNNLKMNVWNDSGIDWAVQDCRCGISTVYFYPQNKFTMKRAIELHGEIFGEPL